MAQKPRLLVQAGNLRQSQRLGDRRRGGVMRARLSGGNVWAWLIFL